MFLSVGVGGVSINMDNEWMYEVPVSGHLWQRRGLESESRT